MRKRTINPERAPGVSLQPVVRWMAKELDDMPDIFKALIWLALIFNGLVVLGVVIKSVILAAFLLVIKQ